MTKNSGKATEKLFQQALKPHGKNVFLFRFDDAADIRGRTGVAGYTKSQPADYLLTWYGETFYAEVKSCNNPRRFPFSQIRTSQRAAAKMQGAAGGAYWIYVYSLVNERWYRMPWQVVAALEDRGTKSREWDQSWEYDFEAV